MSASAAAGESKGGGNSSNYCALDFGEGEVEWLDTDWTPPPRGRSAVSRDSDL
jgi:hypothetical protein